VLQQGQGPGQYNQGQYNQGQYGQPYGAPQAPVGGGGSFLGTAAATAAGMVGGGLLMSSIRSMMGGGHQSGFGDSAGLGGGGRAPWSSDQSGGDLARDAGLNDIGSGGHRADNDSRSGFFDSASNDDVSDHDMDADSDDFDGGDSDLA
jgi:hypothetical protein